MTDKEDQGRMPPPQPSPIQPNDPYALDAAARPVLATSDIRSKIRKETANKNLSRHLLHVETTRKSNG
jgi:hypothetical protein